MSKDEAAELARVSVSTVERAIRVGELRAARASAGLVRIRVEWVEEWLAERTGAAGAPQDQKDRGRAIPRPP
jgi:excisionase family DNA binding protein